MSKRFSKSLSQVRHSPTRHSTTRYSTTLLPSGKRVKMLPSIMAQTLDRSDRDHLLRQQSLFAAQRGNFVLALAGLDSLINRYPQSAPDFNNRGLVNFQAGNWAAAIADYDQAIALDEELANAYNNRANYYAAKGDLFAAVADYQTAIEIDPTNIRAWINQGITFRELEMYIPALDNFEEALDLVAEEEDMSHYIFLSAHIFAERGRTHHLFGDWNCALSDYYEAIAHINHESQTTAYPPLWWQIDGWLSELLQQPQQEDSVRDFRL
jgi:tetratricopeptide (TPR) repeat protein